MSSAHQKLNGLFVGPPSWWKAGQVSLVWNRKSAEMRPAIAKYGRLLPAIFRMEGR
jgi:hypothetical protein